MPVVASSAVPAAPVTGSSGRHSLRGVVHVRRQVEPVGGRQPFAPPKGRGRHGPRDHRAPVGGPRRPLRSAELVLSTRETTALQRNDVNAEVWKPALVAAGLEPSRTNGMQTLRHSDASVLLDAEESVRALAESLGHTDPVCTLRVDTHLMPASEVRTRRAVDQALRGWAGRRLDGVCTECARRGPLRAVSPEGVSC